MHLTRSLFAVVVLGSLMSLPVKTEAVVQFSDTVNWIIGGSAAAVSAFLLLRTPANNPNSNSGVKALDAATNYSQQTVAFAWRWLPTAAAVAGAGWLGFHNTNVANTNLVEFLSTIAKVKPGAKN